MINIHGHYLQGVCISLKYLFADLLNWATKYICIRTLHIFVLYRSKLIVLGYYIYLYYTEVKLIILDNYISVLYRCKPILLGYYISLYYTETGQFTRQLYIFVLYRSKPVLLGNYISYYYAFYAELVNVFLLFRGRPWASYYTNSIYSGSKSHNIVHAFILKQNTMGFE